ncbi:hypothetical protein JB92DRAFT_2838414 [Gautieria morchelliformis]|nr:hypothetical protein JB92DRAFT_2838414 [Gautieria morchelliformis]
MLSPCSAPLCPLFLISLLHAVLHVLALAWSPTSAHTAFIHPTPLPLAQSSEHRFSQSLGQPQTPSAHPSPRQEGGRAVVGMCKTRSRTLAEAWEAEGTVTSGLAHSLAVSSTTVTVVSSSADRIEPTSRGVTLDSCLNVSEPWSPVNCQTKHWRSLLGKLSRLACSELFQAMASRGMDAQAVWKSVSKSTAKSRHITKNDLNAKPNEDPFVSSASDSDSISDNANSVNGNGGGDSGDSESDERCDAGDGNASDDSVSEDGDKASSHHSPDEEEEAKRRKKERKYVEYTLSDIIKEGGFGTEGVKVPKPKGTGGRDFSIREHLGLNTGEEDDKQIYKEILPTREQDNRKVSLVVQHFLKNSSELKPASARRREERLAHLPCEEPQALSVANTSKSAAPVSSSKFTTSKSASAKKENPSKVSSASATSRKGSTMGAGKSSEPAGKGSTTGARKSSEPTGKGSTTGAGKPRANFRSVGNHDQATSLMKRKMPEDGELSVPVAKHYKMLEDVPAPMHAKRLQAASKASVTNKSAPRKTAPKKADPEPRKSRCQLLPTCTLPTDSGSSHILFNDLA